MLHRLAWLYRHQEFQFPLFDAVHCGTESEHQLSYGSLIELSSVLLVLFPFTQILQFNTKLYQYSHKGDKDTAAILHLVLTFRPTLHYIPRRKKLELLMLVFTVSL